MRLNWRVQWLGNEADQEVRWSGNETELKVRWSGNETELEVRWSGNETELEWGGLGMRLNTTNVAQDGRRGGRNTREQMNKGEVTSKASCVSSGNTVGWWFTARPQVHSHNNWAEFQFPPLLPEKVMGVAEVCPQTNKLFQVTTAKWDSYFLATASEVQQSK